MVLNISMALLRATTSNVEVSLAFIALNHNRRSVIWPIAVIAFATKLLVRDVLVILA
jgi:energy-converting hydrogenase Eha subunit E